jgi:cytochrome P450
MTSGDFSAKGVSAKHTDVEASRLLENPSLVTFETATQAGGVSTFKIFNKKIITITNADLASLIQFDNEEYFGRSEAQKHIMQGVVGESILTKDGAAWKSLKGSCNNSLSRNNIEKYHQETQIGLDRALKIQGNQSHEDDLILKRYDFESIFVQTTTKVFLNAELSVAESAKLLDAYVEVETLSANYIKYPILMLLPAWVPHPTNIRMRLKSYAIGQVLGPLINKAISKDSKSSSLLRDMDEEVIREKRCPLKGRDHFSLLKSLYIAAIKTSAVTLEWILMYLSEYPEYWSQLSAECLELYGTDYPNIEDQADPECLENIINETMRLSPTAPLLSRKVIKECTVAGIKMNKKDIIFISVYGIHRSPDYWENPEDFLPNRFLKPHNPKAYLPFQLGPHTCPGQHLARRMIATALIRLAQFYDLEPNRGKSFENQKSVVAVPKYEQNFRFVKRNYCLE